MEVKEVSEGLYYIQGDYYTINLNPGERVYGERILKIEGKEYRRWDPYRSKLAGALKKGLSQFPFTKDSNVLYLGASTGTTVSHLSDICVDGQIFAVEVSPKMMEKLLVLSEKRENIIPILADARKPSEYREIGEVDVLYQDIAQPDQERIFILNAKNFLKQGGDGILCLKAHSIDVTLPKEEVLRSALEILGKEMAISQYLDLDPYDKEHYFIHTKREL